jgi:LmbE family N-acetylglucosaminyl deacetylase
MTNEISKRVLAISAHPDDFEIASSFAVMKYQNEGYDIYSILITDGEKGGDPKRRIKEAENAGKMLGIMDIERLRFQDTNIPEDGRLIADLEELYSKYHPEVILTHSQNDRHQDHIKVSGASTIAFRKATTILLYMGFSGNINFKPNMFVVGTKEDLEKKIEVCNCYKSQAEKGIIDNEFICASARYWGHMLNVYDPVYAEPFEMNQMVMNGLELHEIKRSNNGNGKSGK